ncbi:hypothetical protein PYW08_015802 [Mythimna loreyi]|uniref:Uncharacterized protein n=1 Tax=Mythimna loreyi TaxID=667449 RepID=A0ACC2QRQ0_9NEOP|nr:hypothetical protein PYW08_015802 [Mythimna loreyi]
MLLDCPSIVLQKDHKMAGKITAAFVILVAVAFLATFDHVSCSPAIAIGYDPRDICIENCAQCKKMFGKWFDGPLCAESCFIQKGKWYPECEDINSIGPFIIKHNNDDNN